MPLVPRQPAATGVECSPRVSHPAHAVRRGMLPPCRPAASPACCAGGGAGRPLLAVARVHRGGVAADRRTRTASTLENALGRRGAAAGRRGCAGRPRCRQRRRRSRGGDVVGAHLEALRCGARRQSTAARPRRSASSVDRLPTLLDLVDGRRGPTQPRTTHTRRPAHGVSGDQPAARLARRIRRGPGRALVRGSAMSDDLDAAGSRRSRRARGDLRATAWWARRRPRRRPGGVALLVVAPSAGAHAVHRRASWPWAVSPGLSAWRTTSVATADAAAGTRDARGRARGRRCWPAYAAAHRVRRPQAPGSQAAAVAAREHGERRVERWDGEVPGSCRVWST